ncbi:MAG: YlxR family protein [Clostridiales bacterium]|nr:YlxR family protein [Clostridiales bacterium]
MKSKKTPMRMCLGCRQMLPKRDLIRIVLPKEGELSADPTGRAHGRGAYVCRNLECLSKASKQKAVRLPSELVEQLKKEITGEES